MAGPGAFSHSETRHFTNGHSLLGYLEGRPFITDVLGFRKVSFVENVGAPAKAPRSIVDQVRALPVVEESEPRSKSRKRLMAVIIAAWEAAEDGGCELETEITGSPGDAA